VEVFSSGQVVVDAEGIGHVPNLAPDGPGISDDVEARDQRATGGRLQ
jgi:hypothetical protein